MSELEGKDDSGSVVVHDELKVSINYAREQQLTAQCLVAFSTGFSKASGLAAELESQDSLNGFTGRSFRHLLNSLCKMQNCTYLEVGTFCGSSLVSALYGNHGKIKKAYAIDNWSEFREYCNKLKTFDKALGSLSFDNRPDLEDDTHLESKQSYYLRRNVLRGESLSTNDLVYQRPRQKAGIITLPKGKNLLVKNNLKIGDLLKKNDID